MKAVFIPPGPGGSGTGLWLPVDSGKKVLSLTGREIHPVAIEIGAITGAEVINGYADIPPDDELLCVVIHCAGPLRCALYPKKNIMTVNVLPTGQGGLMAQSVHDGNYVSGVTPDLVQDAEMVECAGPDPAHPPDTAAGPVVTQMPPPAHGVARCLRLVVRAGTAVGEVTALLFAAGREAVDVTLRTVMPCLAGVSLWIALVQETGLTSLSARDLTPLLSSLWGLLALAVICGLPFLSPVLATGAALFRMAGIMAGTGIAAGLVPPALALPALFALTVPVGCHAVPVGLAMQGARPETIAKGVPAFLLSRQLTGPLAVIIGWVFSFGVV